MFTSDKIVCAWPPVRLGLLPLPCSSTAMAPYNFIFQFRSYLFIDLYITFFSRIISNMSIEVNDHDMDSLISLADAASIYGFTPDHLRHLAQKKRLEAQKIGGVWLTTRANVEEYIESRQRRGAYRADITPEQD